MVFLFGGPAFSDFPVSNTDWFYSEFEMEESEEVGEEDTLIQDAEFSIEISLTSSRVHHSVIIAPEWDRYERHDTRGPPVAC
ncbi:MAG: hypothetical protein K0U86_06520 [Planctomycetes bacterium]|nr:hypothetical protein [Planctomycetota bacterium]MCH9724542.1 hypothetical protein [Planctomycetota bacterium]MCH9779396.1 hypothetical protein [Planctomycetota bacterium]MCH9791824.1 hypothetical protein [Planctomycetota bacterium]